MNMFKMALLGGAALAVSAAGAQADELTALKAQIESLNARVASMEAAPSVPAGYSLLTVSEGTSTVVPGNALEARDQASYGTRATIISVLPTADAPAATTIEWSGYARAAIVYGMDTTRFFVRIDDNGTPADLTDDFDVFGFDDDIDVLGRGQLKVVGKTDTAVGEVGARLQLRGNFHLRDTNAEMKMNEAWGWWAMTPELTLGGGFTGSLGNIGYGYDGACNCYYTDNADVGMNPGDATQMRLSWASGPFSAAVAVEDDEGVDDAIAGAGEIKYTGDMFNGEISGYASSENRWRAGAGIGFALGDIANISLGAQYGDKATVGGKDVFWTASILASVNLSDEVHAEVAYGHTDYNDRNYTVDAVLAGIYYDPVAQLTIGLEGEYIMDGSYTKTSRANASGVDRAQVDLVTVFRF